eukprot:GABW01003511.1.p1 GENE.GABW01003511.1~~GABW01003511.1.p1  ORF type:complete len:55 (-),score=0.39 GABW01003511.1:163-327(-)
MSVRLRSLFGFQPRQFTRLQPNEYVRDGVIDWREMILRAQIARDQGVRHSEGWR